MMRRVKREAALLQGVSDDDAAEVSLVLGIGSEFGESPEQQELLKLRVKPTFNDPKDPTAFFHSIASYGMEFALNENITQLAHRNEKMEAFQVLVALEKRLGLSAREDLELEAALLTAVANDQGEEVTQLLRSALGDPLLNLQVKETYKDPHDRTAFYHSVASYGLKFELGDTLHGLAVRNERPAAAQSLQSFGAPIERPLAVLVTNAVNGQELCRVSALTTWTILDVAKEVAAKAPAPGCRVFLLGGAALTTGTTLGDLSGEADELELSSLVRSNVHGIYSATVVPTEEDEPLPMLAMGRLGRRGRRSPKHFQMELKEDGTASFDYSERPIDHGRCAPPSGGLLVSGRGLWTFDGPGLKVVISDGDIGHFIRSSPQRDRKLERPFTVMLTMVKEDQMDVVSLVDKDPAERPSFARIFCPMGTAFVKCPEGQKDGSRRFLTWR